MSKNELTTPGLIKSYLNEVKKRSTGEFNNSKMLLRSFFRYVKKEIKDITMVDVRDYFENDLDKKKIQNNTKNTRRYMLKGFFDHVVIMYLSENKNFNNPVPNRKIYQFTRKEGDIQRYEESKEKEQIFDNGQLIQIWDYCLHRYKLTFRFMWLRDFVLIVLIICTGARISEIRTIQLQDIHLDKRYFETGFVMGARKSTMNKKKGLLFFFPEKIVYYLRSYIELLEEKKGKDNIWLFPGQKGSVLTDMGARLISSKISKHLDIKIKWHSFRRTMITARVKMECPLYISEMLMNHAPSSVESKSYIKLNLEEKREYYDRFFPFEFLLTDEVNV